MANLREAIDEKCKECIYEPKQKGFGGWRQQVAACTSQGCPLYSVRPIPKVKKTPVLEEKVTVLARIDDEAIPTPSLFTGAQIESFSAENGGV